MKDKKMRKDEDEEEEENNETNTFERDLFVWQDLF